MQSMHYAVDKLELDTIFPEVQTTSLDAIATADDVQKCLEALKDSELNTHQVKAITSILDANCVKVQSNVQPVCVYQAMNFTKRGSHTLV